MINFVHFTSAFKKSRHIEKYSFLFERNETVNLQLMAPLSGKFLRGQPWASPRRPLRQPQTVAPVAPLAPRLVFLVCTEKTLTGQLGLALGHGNTQNLRESPRAWEWQTTSETPWQNFWNSSRYVPSKFATPWQQISWGMDKLLGILGFLLQIAAHLPRSYHETQFGYKTVATYHCHTMSYSSW